MARNISKDYALMDEDERRRFAQKLPGGEAPSELDFTEPRDEENQGHSQMAQDEESEDPEHRDGVAAQLDDERHERKVQRKKK